MAKFHVRDTFEIATDRKLFVLAGWVVEGEIRKGMFVQVPFNSSFGMAAQIHSVEFALRADGGEDVCLCLRSESELAGILRDLNIGDETLEVTTDSSFGRSGMKNVIVTKEVLELYDKYDGDFGLLDERWADKRDRENVTDEQCSILGQYVDRLMFTQLEPGLYSVQMMEAALKRITELEEMIADEVIGILRKRLLKE